MRRIRIGLLASTLCLFFSSQTKAQEFEANNNDHDELPYYFGLTFGYNNSFLHTVRNANFYNAGNAFSHVEPKGGSGIELGLMGTLKLADHWELRAVPKLIIGGSKSLTYYYRDGMAPSDAAQPPVAGMANSMSESMKLPQTLISLPLHLKFLSDRIGNLRAYVFAGPKLDFNLSANGQEYTKERELNGATAPQFRKSSIGAEGGIGVHIYLPFAVISPEIRVGTSLQNDHLRDMSNPYSAAFNRINARMLSFSINIEQ